MPSKRIAYITAKNRERMRARRAKLIEMLGGHCVRCGTTDDLEFDHVDPSTKRFTIGGNLSRPWDVLVQEAKRCQLLCNPCHRKKAPEDYPETPHGLYRYADLGCRCEVCRAANAAKSAARRARRKAAQNGEFR
jgi:5-methylcytosine-specific restriction endonuclease McrA